MQRYATALLPFRFPIRSNQSIRTSRVQSNSRSVREKSGVAESLAGLNRINGGNVHGPVWEGSFLDRVTADRPHLSVPFVDQYTGVCGIDATRFPLKHLKKRCSEKEEHSSDLTFRVCEANCLEKFRDIMLAKIGRNLARVDQLDEQRRRPPCVFFVRYRQDTLTFVTWSIFMVARLKAIEVLRRTAACPWPLTMRRRLNDFGACPLPSRPRTVRS